MCVVAQCLSCHCPLLLLILLLLLLLLLPLLLIIVKYNSVFIFTHRVFMYKCLMNLLLVLIFQ